MYDFPLTPSVSVAKPLSATGGSARMDIIREFWQLRASLTPPRRTRSPIYGNSSYIAIARARIPRNIIITSTERSRKVTREYGDCLTVKYIEL